MRGLVLFVVASTLAGQTLADKAYEALRAEDYAQSIGAFESAITAEPGRAALRMDLAYTLLKIGENEAARDQFAEAMRLDPADYHAALEYAFLCYETKEQVIARRVFDRLRKTADPASRATAEQAFQNIDRPLAEGIERWSKAAPSFSSLCDLAKLAEQRDMLDLAARSYEAAWKLRPEARSLLVDLGRVWKQLGQIEESNSALLAASRGAEPRAAENARELLGPRYPYPYEFLKALDLDPKNVELRRELAYLYLEMGLKPEADRQFEILQDSARPKLSCRPEASKADAKLLAEKSFKAGYMKDAVKYLRIAHEDDPTDYAVALKLGWAYNILHDDREAIKWFDLARKSSDPKIASEAGKAYGNLRPALALVRTTAWALPFYSSRWHDTFTYGQVKTEFRLGSLPLRLYLSTRFIGDTRGSIRPTLAGIQPQYLSESSLIFGAGLSTAYWRGFTGWMEAGEAVKYLGGRKDVGAMIPDYRGGLSFARGLGHIAPGESHGFFAETTDDGVFVSRFQNDFLAYSQNRTGYTMRGGQLYWNWNVTADRGRQYWANFVETGPGFRFRWKVLPPGVLFSVNFLRGVYTMNEGNPRRPNYFDFRAGFWYAFTH